MGQYLTLLAVGTTAAAACVVGVRVLGLSSGRLPAAAGSMLACLGAGVLFLLLNLVTEVAVVFGVRAVTGRFVSLYGIGDTMLVILSFVQGTTFQLWRDRSRM